MSFLPGKDKDLLFSDFTNFIKGDLGKTEWITVFEFFDNKYSSVDRGSYYCALIPEVLYEKCLEKADWDTLIGSRRPGFITTYNKGKEDTRYYRFGDNDGIEPLVYWRSSKSHNVSILEISEEFRLYFDLFESEVEGKRIFFYTNDDGDDEDVVIMTKQKIDIKLKFLKEFLSVKKMGLAIYFEVMRFLPNTLEKSEVLKIDKIEKDNSYTYSIFTRDIDLGDAKCQGWLLGKKIIKGNKDYKFSYWKSKEDERFEDFIVGVDEEGKDILASSNTDYQSKTSFLTPVFFKREVLKKYYDSPNIFTVEDGYLRRENFWSLRIMNNHSDHVVVWLGDFKIIPYKEQSHWKSFNVTPGDKKIAQSDFLRNIKGQFCDSEHPELYFKYKFKEFQEAWKKKFGWYLFEPLHIGDEYHVKTLHIPTTENEKEFEDQILSISKILVDSINQKELKKNVETSKSEPAKIDYLQYFLEKEGCNLSKMIEFLQKLNALRSSSVAHRKGKKMKSAYKYFDLEKKSKVVVFNEILIKCIWMFNSLDRHFKLTTE